MAVCIPAPAAYLREVMAVVRLLKAGVKGKGARAAAASLPARAAHSAEPRARERAQARDSRHSLSLSLSASGARCAVTQGLRPNPHTTELHRQVGQIRTLLQVTYMKG